MQIHFIAIGGATMHNLALALYDKGYTVTGSDDTIHEPSKSRLADAGLLPDAFGWFPDKIHTDLDAVILGMHAKKDNPELLKAQALGLKIYSYPEFLYEQSKNKTRVVIGGSHGKTTITAMILHVMQYWNQDVDYMVGAQLEGFDRMVHLTETNEFIILEGDEYLSSALDLRPKFHLYKPHIALVSGIAWDHINVFPTFDNYVEQFSTFINSIEPGGMLVYNEVDKTVEQLVLASEHTIKHYPYTVLPHQIEGGKMLLQTDEGAMALQVFGQHNLQNMAGAKWVCQLMGIQEHEFYEAIASFKGAGKRLELVYQSDKTIVYKDFAHAPSKVTATVNAVKTQYKDKRLMACLELHTYSSLTPEFLKEYQNTLAKADVAMVFYAPHAVAIKGLKPLTEKQIKTAFQRDDLQIFTDTEAFKAHLFKQSFDDTVLLLMSSGNYGGLAIGELVETVKQKA